MAGMNWPTISLIGMPGAGKSTVGVVLAKAAGLGFVDTDLLIQQRAGATLQQILERDGYLRLRELERAVILELEPRGLVVATGGSAVYSEEAMAKLAAAGPIVYLRADLDTLQRRIAAHPDRGLANDRDWTLERIYRDRTPRYAAHAGCTVDVDQGSVEDIADTILLALAE